MVQIQNTVNKLSEKAPSLITQSLRNSREKSEMGREHLDIIMRGLTFLRP